VDGESEMATRARVILFSILRHGRERRIAYYISSYDEADHNRVLHSAEKVVENCKRRDRLCYKRFAPVSGTDESTR